MDLQAVQPAFTFPQPLTEKYRPRKVADFVGLEKPKRIARRLIKTPMPNFARIVKDRCKHTEALSAR